MKMVNSTYKISSHVVGEVAQTDGQASKTLECGL